MWHSCGMERGLIASCGSGNFEGRYKKCSSYVPTNIARSMQPALLRIALPFGEQKILVVFHVLCQKYFICKSYMYICIASSRLRVRTAPKLMFSLGPEMF